LSATLNVFVCRDDDEEDGEQNAEEEHQSLDHHAWTQTHIRHEISSE